MNGRVDILGPNLPDPFSLYDKIPVSQTTSYKDAYKGIGLKALYLAPFLALKIFRLYKMEFGLAYTKVLKVDTL